MKKHIDAQIYAEKLVTGTTVRADDEHIANCDLCRSEVEHLVQQKKDIWQGDALGELLRFTSDMTRGIGRLLASPLNTVLEAKHEKVAEKPKKREPLRLFLPQTFGWFQSSQGKFLMVVLISILAFVVPSPPGLSDSAHRALVVFIFTAGILTFQPVSLPLAALMVPVATILLGVGTASQSFEPFSRPVVFLILASLFLAEGLRKHRITRRLALKTIIASGGDVRKLLFGLMSIAAVLSMWVENTATAAVLIPVALTISRAVEDRDEARSLLVLLVLGIAYSASLGGMVTIMGAASNAVASGFLVEIQPWSFLDWSKYGLPSFLLIFPVTWWLLLKMIPVSIGNLDLDKIKERADEMGKMSGNEKEIIATMLVAAIFWVFGSLIEESFGFPPTMFSSSVVAVIAVLYLAVRGSIDWEDIKGVSWGIFFIIGAGLSLGETLGRSGATDFLATLMAPVVTGPPLFVSLLILVFVSAILTNILNNTTIAAVLVPVLISVSASNPEFGAVQLVIPVTMATTFGYSLPSASGRMALIGASGLVSSGEMMRYGLITTIVSALLLTGLFYGLTVLNLI